MEKSKLLNFRRFHLKTWYGWKLKFVYRNLSRNFQNHVQQTLRLFPRLGCFSDNAVSKMLLLNGYLLVGWSLTALSAQQGYIVSCRC